MKIGYIFMFYLPGSSSLVACLLEVFISRNNTPILRFFFRIIRLICDRNRIGNVTNICFRLRLYSSDVIADINLFYRK